MANMTDSMCQFLMNSFDSFLTTIQGAKVGLITAITTLKTSIRTLQYSATDQLQEMEATVNNKLGDIVPSVGTKDDLTQFVDIINRCPFLTNSPTFSRPLNIMKCAAIAIKESSIGQVDALTSALPEFSVGKNITNLLNTYSPVGFDFSKIVPNCFQIIECLDSICDRDISDRYQSLITNMKQLYLLTTGGFDRGQLYQDLKLNGSKILNIEIGVSTYNNLNNTINSSINKSLSYMKSLGSGLGL